jgi:ABC-2 type transport system permease protein
MAQLTLARWSQSQTVAQYKAIAWLRWRMFVNISRRTNTPAEIAGRVLLYLIMGGFAVFLTAAAGGSSYLLASEAHLSRLWVVFWAIFGLCQLLNINLGQPGTTFDPTQLIRFPLRVPTYVAIRLFFNLLSPANIMAALMSLAVAVGVTLAIPSLWFYALIACAVFALANVLFSRMIFAWVDRWLSTRRAREVFTGLIFVFSLGFQYVNLTVNAGFSKGHRHNNAITRQRIDAANTFYHRAEPILRYTPPNLTSAAIASGSEHQSIGFLAGTAGTLAFAALFLGVFAIRTRTEFHGEAFSDTATASSVPAPHRATHAPVPSLAAAPTGSADTNGALLALLGKEWTYMRRNTGVLYGLITPLFLVVLFALRLGRNMTSPWVLPIAIAYSLVGIAPLSYNSFGVDGTGAQMYFMAPVPIATVFIAKNILHFALAAIEVVVVIGVMSYVSGTPNPVTILGLILWVVGSLLLNTSLGNRRSISAPKKINLGRMSGKQASQASALMSLGILVACVGYGAGVLTLATYVAIPWLSLPCFAALAAAGIFVYQKSLSSQQAYTLTHRDTLFEELGKS